MDVNYKNNLIILTGPTAAGKTALSIKLAKEVNGEIISADSMQVYKGMDIGTAKITQSEMDGVKHHLIDILSPADDFNVTLFKKFADEAINDITSRGKIPILTGGTGFYIQAVLYDIDFTKHESDSGIRDELSKFANENGIQALYDKLIVLDKDAAANIHPNNVKRVIRAIEYCLTTGQLFSKHNSEQSAKKSPYNFAYFVLNMNRNTLYERIEKRIDIMLKNGLVEEVKRLMDEGCKREMVSMQGLGYKEVIDYLTGVLSYDEMIYVLKRETRHFAKRQITWFKREQDVIWLDKDKSDENELLDEMIQILKDKQVISNEKEF